MWYLALPEDSSLRISFGLVYMAFLDCDDALEYAHKHGLRCVVFDSLDFGSNFIPMKGGESDE